MYVVTVNAPRHSDDNIAVHLEGLFLLLIDMIYLIVVVEWWVRIRGYVLRTWKCSTLYIFIGNYQIPEL